MAHRGCRSETDPNAAAPLPDDIAVFLGAAVVERKPAWDGAGAVHFDAGAASADVDNGACGCRAFQIGKHDRGFGDQPARADTMKPSMLRHLSHRDKGAPDWDHRSDQKLKMRNPCIRRRLFAAIS